uniref:MutL_C domain-containing protein n=1 Tax=Mesocestoides corti TaxID=53468 RepID=A0A5K3FGP9_MESCO
MPSRSTFSGFPVLVLNIQLPRAKVDVNLSPDKRQLLLHWERPVVMKVKAALVATLGCNDGQQSLASISNLGDSNTFVEGGGEGCSPVRSLQLTQQPLISPHLTITPSTPEARSSPQLAKRPRLSMPVCQLQTTSPSTPSARKSIFASDSARKTYDNNLPILNRRRIDVNFSLERLHRYWMSQDEPAESTEVSSTGCFHAGLTESSAESELTTLFKREWFKDMRVVGQFNKGFIICQHEKDLFIVDQHASDEKYRFECLCANHQFTSQPLVSPQQLTLNAVQEHVLEENMEVFANNGFAFSVDENAPLGRRYCLVSAPMSEGKVFGRAGM